MAVYLAAAVAMVLMASPLVGQVGKLSPVPLRQSFDNFPMQLGDRKGLSRNMWRP
jgi:hypothetical protein